MHTHILCLYTAVCVLLIHVGIDQTCNTASPRMVCTPPAVVSYCFTCWYFIYRKQPRRISCIYPHRYRFAWCSDCLRPANHDGTAGQRKVTSTKQKQQQQHTLYARRTTCIDRAVKQPKEVIEGSEISSCENGRNPGSDVQDRPGSRHRD